MYEFGSDIPSKQLHDISIVLIGYWSNNKMAGTK